MVELLLELASTIAFWGSCAVLAFVLCCVIAAAELWWRGRGHG